MAIHLQKHLQALIDQRRDIAFLVDFDGTMVDLVPDPDGVHVPPQLIRDIGRVAASRDGAFAIVTGRTIGRLDQFLGGAVSCAIGNYGAECRFARDAEVQSLAAPMPHLVRDAVRQAGERHHCIFEDKIFGLSVHLPLAQMTKSILPELQEALGHYVEDYAIYKIGRTYEVVPRGVSKGSGVRHLMKQSPFRGRMPVYIGCDVFIDKSLQEIPAELGGVLLPARHQHHTLANSGGVLETGDVRNLIAALAATVTGDSAVQSGIAVQ